MGITECGSRFCRENGELLLKRAETCSCWAVYVYPIRNVCVCVYAHWDQFLTTRQFTDTKITPWDISLAVYNTLAVCMVCATWNLQEMHGEGNRQPTLSGKRKICAHRSLFRHIDIISRKQQTRFAGAVNYRNVILGNVENTPLLRKIRVINSLAALLIEKNLTEAVN